MLSITTVALIHSNPPRKSTHGLSMLVQKTWRQCSSYHNFSILHCLPPSPSHFVSSTCQVIGAKTCLACATDTCTIMHHIKTRASLKKISFSNSRMNTSQQTTCPMCNTQTSRWNHPLMPGPIASMEA